MGQRLIAMLKMVMLFMDMDKMVTQRKKSCSFVEQALPSHEIILLSLSMVLKQLAQLELLF